MDKIHTDDPQVEDHSIFFPKEEVRITLELTGVFSFFPTETATQSDLEEEECVLILSPQDPNSEHFASNERSIMNSEGEIVEEKHRTRILLSEVQESQSTADFQISSTESEAIDTVFDSGPDPMTSNEACELCSLMIEKSNEAHFMNSIGASHPCMKKYPLDDDTVTTDASTGDEDSDSDSETESESEASGEIFPEEHDFADDEALDQFMAAAAHAEKPTGLSADQLSKVWRIDLETAKRTIGVTTQKRSHSEQTEFSRNYSTNDRMLRYKRINQYFFMDTFFATSAGGTSSRGHTCCQLFVTDKGFVHVVPMRKKSEVLQALKEFAKEVGAPEAIICDASKEQTSLSLRKFCNDMGTTLRILEEGTQWANKAELYIGLIKEAVHKDMKDSDCPLRLWDYCVECRARINNLTARNLFSLY